MEVFAEDSARLRDAPQKTAMEVWRTRTPLHKTSAPSIEVSTTATSRNSSHEPIARIEHLRVPQLPRTRSRLRRGHTRLSAIVAQQKKSKQDRTPEAIRCCTGLPAERSTTDPSSSLRHHEVKGMPTVAAQVFVIVAATFRKPQKVPREQTHGRMLHDRSPGFGF